LNKYKNIILILYKAPVVGHIGLAAAQPFQKKFPLSACLLFFRAFFFISFNLILRTGEDGGGGSRKIKAVRQQAKGGPGGSGAVFAKGKLGKFFQGNRLLLRQQKFPRFPQGAVRLRAALNNSVKIFRRAGVEHLDIFFPHLYRSAVRQGNHYFVLPLLLYQRGFIFINGQSVFIYH